MKRILSEEIFGQPDDDVMDRRLRTALVAYDRGEQGTEGAKAFVRLRRRIVRRKDEG